MSFSREELLGHASSNESDSDQGYDSEAAEISKISRVAVPERGRKRRKLSHSASEGDASDTEGEAPTTQLTGAATDEEDRENQSPEGSADPETSLIKQTPRTTFFDGDINQSETVPKQERKKTKNGRPRPGVVYLSSVPPHLRPSALRNLLEQRGFSPITRFFLTPITKDVSKKMSSTSKARRSYSEGWIEFSTHKTAKLCAQTLNATPIGGKKGGYYRDDLWNMKYLRGMGWEELMEGVRGEQREQEARRDEERRQIQTEATIFLEGVEEGKRVEGIREKRKRKGQADRSGAPIRTFRQFEAQEDKSDKAHRISAEAQEVLGKLF